MTLIKALLLGSTMFRAPADMGNGAGFTITATSDEVPPWKEGDTIETPEDQVAYLKGMTQLGDPTDISEYDDDELLALAKLIASENPEAEATDLEVLFCEACEEGRKADIEEAGEALPETLAALAVKLDKDKTISSLMLEVIDGANKVEGNPAYMLAHILHNLLPTAAERAILPRWGQEGGNNPDIYRTTKRNAEGDDREVKGSRFKDLVAMHSVVQGKQTLMDQITNAVPKGQSLSTVQSVEVKNLKNDKNNAARCLTIALRAMQVWDILAEHKHVGVEFVTQPCDAKLAGKPGVVEREEDGEKTYEKIGKGKFTIYLFNRHKVSEGVKLSVRSLAGFKPAPNMRLKDVQKSGRRTARTTTTFKFTAKDGPAILAGTVNGLEDTGIRNSLQTFIMTEQGNDTFLTLARLRDIVTDLVDKADTPMVADKVTVKNNVKTVIPGKPSRLQALRAAEIAAGNAPEEQEEAA